MFAQVYIYIPHDIFPSHCCYFWWSRLFIHCQSKFKIQSSMFLWFMKIMLTIRDRMVQELLLSLSPSYMWTISHTACFCVCLGCSTFKFRTKCSVCLFGFCLRADVHYFVNSFTMTIRQLNSFYFQKFTGYAIDEYYKPFQMFNSEVLLFTHYLGALHIGILNNSKQTLILFASKAVSVAMLSGFYLTVIWLFENCKWLNYSFMCQTHYARTSYSD